MLYAVFRGHIFLSISERRESIVNLVNVYQNLSMATCNALVLVGARSPTTTTTVVVQQSANAVETFLFLRFPPGGTSASQNWAYDTSTVTGMNNLYTIKEFYITSHAHTQIWYMSCTTPGIYDCRLTYDTKDSFLFERICVLCSLYWFVVQEYDSPNVSLKVGFEPSGLHTSIADGGLPSLRDYEYP